MTKTERRSKAPHGGARTCLSLWERWHGEAVTERGSPGEVKAHQRVLLRSEGKHKYVILSERSESKNLSDFCSTPAPSRIGSGPCPAGFSLVTFFSEKKKVTYFREFLYAKFTPQVLWNVERLTVEYFPENFAPQRLLKSSKRCTLACGEKSVAALRETPVIHIIFP